jgi:hypothetical protein
VSYTPAEFFLCFGGRNALILIQFCFLIGGQCHILRMAAKYREPVEARQNGGPFHLAFPRFPATFSTAFATIVV